MRGFGAQFFTDLFDGAPQVPPHLAAVLADLGPGHSRIAVEPEATNPANPKHAPLMSTLGLADQAGANVNLTWWHGPYFRDKNHPTEDGFLGKEQMHRFGDFLEEARATFSCELHATIQNEVNSHDIGHQGKASVSMALYNRLYRLLDAELKARADPKRPAKKLRSAIKLVGGDLVLGGPAGIPGSNQADWIKFMQANMADVLDGYSIHVYAAIGDFAKLEKRLAGLLDFRIGKPVYVTEYGIRGTDFPDPHKLFDPGSLHGKNVEDSVESAFHTAWFNALAPHHGIVGLAKWACYRIDKGKTTPVGPRRPERDSGMISGVGKGFAPTHTFDMTLLFNRAVGRDWLPTQLGRAPDTLVSTFTGPAGELSAIVVNRSSGAKDVRIDRLLGSHSYFAAAWNHGGIGTVTKLPLVPAGPGGVTTVPGVPGSGMVALSTRPLGL
jgi:hypothetical protein